MKRTFSTDLPGKYGHAALLFFRVLVAFLMLTHGYPKLERLFSGEEIQFADPLGLGPAISLVLIIVAEVVCSVLIIIGLATRLATIPIIIGMTTVVTIIHADDPFGVREKPLLFLICFVFLLVVGAGKYSVDGIVNRES